MRTVRPKTGARGQGQNRACLPRTARAPAACPCCSASSRGSTRVSNKAKNPDLRRQMQTHPWCGEQARSSDLIGKIRGAEWGRWDAETLPTRPHAHAPTHPPTHPPTRLRTRPRAYPHQLLWEGPARVLRHVDGRDDPVPLLSPQPAGVGAQGPRAKCVPRGLSRVQGWGLPAFLRRLWEEGGEETEKSVRFSRRTTHRLREAVGDRQREMGRCWGERPGVREGTRGDLTHTQKGVPEPSGGETPNRKKT